MARVRVFDRQGSGLTIDDVATAGIRVHQPVTLQEFVRRTIRRSLGFHRLDHAHDLPLPTVLKNDLSTLTIKDFHILSGEWTGEHHCTNLMPAVCRIDGIRVLLRVCEKATPPPDDPSYIRQFEHLVVYTVQVFRWVDNLYDYIQEWRERRERCPEVLIWRVAEYLATKAAELPEDAKFTSSSVHFLDGQFFLRTHTHSAHLPIPGRRWLENQRLQVYTPPEVVNFRSRGLLAFDERIHCWTIGVIMYEMAALESVYYSRSSTNHVVEVVSLLINGRPPPPVRDLMNYSEELQTLMRNCTCNIQSRRPSLEEIRKIARENLEKLTVTEESHR